MLLRGLKAGLSPKMRWYSFALAGPHLSDSIPEGHTLCGTWLFRIVAVIGVISHEQIRPFSIRIHHHGNTEGSYSWDFSLVKAVNKVYLLNEGCFAIGNVSLQWELHFYLSFPSKVQPQICFPCNSSVKSLKWAMEELSGRCRLLCWQCCCTNGKRLVLLVKWG